jgi:hypothetical protein
LKLTSFALCLLILLQSSAYGAEDAKKDLIAKPKDTEKKEYTDERPPRVRVVRERTTFIYVRPRVNPWASIVGNIAGAITSEVLAERRARQYESSLQASEARNSGVGYGNLFSAQRQIGDDVNPTPVVKPAEGPLATFTSDPPGAEVRIDGQYAGTTPTAEIRAKEGTHRVTIRLVGYLNWTGDMLAVPGEVAAIRADLEPAPLDQNKPKISGLQ